MGRCEILGVPFPLTPEKSQPISETFHHLDQAPLFLSEAMQSSADEENRE